MAGLVVNRRARILQGHEWVFSGEVLKVFGRPNDGDVISLKDGKDPLIGSAIYNSKSQIVARRFSRRRQDLDIDFFRRRIAQASEYRDRRSVDPNLRRVVWSESDGLPGVIIDRYGDHLVLQTLTLAMDMRKDLLVEARGGAPATGVCWMVAQARELWRGGVGVRGEGKYPGWRKVGRAAPSRSEAAPATNSMRDGTSKMSFNSCVRLKKRGHSTI